MTRNRPSTRRHIDWQAVTFTVSGTRMPNLTPDERRMVVRRLKHRLETVSGCTLPPLPGRLSTAMVAQRLGVTDRSVERVLADLGEAPKRDCPVCGTQMWLLPDSLVEAHPDSLLNQCPLSNYLLDTITPDDLTALSVSWLAGWLRAGDSHGVMEYIRGLSDVKLTAVIVAAFAAIPDKDAEELFAWTVAS